MPNSKRSARHGRPPRKKPSAPSVSRTRLPLAMKKRLLHKQPPRSPQASTSSGILATALKKPAGSLGKLISKMDFGGDNTIEGLVRELLKPMIKEWLDANLPSIVDEKVEAEVQRIARMAR